MSVILITHNLGVIAETARKWRSCMRADRGVYRGKTIFGNPMHPYTQGLLKSIPRLDEAHARKASWRRSPGWFLRCWNFPGMQVFQPV